jgi:hypothetical protein
MKWDAVDSQILARNNASGYLRPCHTALRMVKDRTKKVKGELQSVRLAYIWHNQQDRNINKLNKTFRVLYSDMERRVVQLFLKRSFSLLMRNQDRLL